MQPFRLLVLSALAVSSIAAHAGNRTLQAPARINVGNTDALGFLATGDFTGDGKADVLVSDFATANRKIRVAPGLGNGTFAATVITDAAGYVPQGAADFNGDAILDLYLYNASGIGVMLGAGDGTFAPATATTLPVAVDAMVAGNFTGDASIDLAAISNNGNQIILLTGNGAGGFPSQQPYSFSIFGVNDAVAGDFDDDGLLDLAVTGSGDTFIAWNSGTGFIGANVATNSMEGIAAGDVNGDGITDLVVSGENASFVCYGTATRVLTATALPGTAMNASSAGVVTVATLNADARADILGGGGALTVVTHDGVALQTPHSFSIGELADHLGTADFDADGKIDVVGTPGLSGSGYFWIVRGKGDGSLYADATFDVGGAVNSFGGFGWGQFITDVNGDGENDVIVITYLQDEVAVLLGNGDGTFAAPVFTELPSTSNASVHDASDLNGDGRTDLILWDASDSEEMHFWSLFSQVDGTFNVGPPQTSDKILGNVTHLERIADYTGDGLPDLFEQTGLLHPGLGNGVFGTPIATGIETLSASTFASTAIADINNDTHPDLLALIGNTLSAYINAGDGTFAAPVITPWNSGALSAADVNDDGFADLTAPTLALGVGNGTFTYGFALGASSSIAGDFDGDGNTDLANASAILFGTGAGAFDFASSTGATGAILSIDDFDDNGADDLWMLNGGWLTIVRTVDNEAALPSDLDLSALANPVPYPGPGQLIARPVPATNTMRASGAVLFSIPPAAPFGMALVGDDGRVTWGFGSPDVGDSITYAATFTGDSFYLPSSSAPLNITVAKGPTITTLTATRGTYELGRSVVITGLVRGGPGGAAITGTITVRKNGELWQTLTAPTQTLGINDPAIFPLGTHTLTAEYSGDDRYLASSFSTLTITIVKAVTTITLSEPPQPLTSAQQISLTASFPNHPNVTGTVTFSCFGQTLGSAAIASAQAVLSTKLPWGEGLCTASYAGDNSHQAASDVTNWITVHYGAMPTAPLVDATASTNTATIRISPISGATNYDLYRSLDGAPMTLRTNTSLSSFNDTSIPAGTKVALYAAVARSATGTVTPMGLRDLASFVIFTDDPIVASSTKVKALHFTELQNAINAVRVAAGLATTTFAAPTGVISTAQMNSLRTALTQARSALGLATPLTDPTLAPGITRIRAVHVQDLRNGVK